MARSFNGSSDYIDLGRPAFPPQITQAFWINWQSGAPTSNSAIGINVGFDGTTFQSLVSRWNGGRSSWDWGTYNGTTFGIFTGTAFGFAQNVWFHFVGLYNGAAWQTYVNGALLDSVSTVQGPFAPTENLTFGCQINNTGTTAFFQGYLADLGYWKAALTLSEIKSLYWGAARPYQVRPQSLIGYWDLQGYTSPGWNRAVSVVPAGIVHGTTNAPGPPRISDVPIIIPEPDPSFVMTLGSMMTVPQPLFMLMPQIVT
jgi:hypothetical protein